jgi:hypothetical protein
MVGAGMTVTAGSMLASTCTCDKCDKMNVQTVAD